MPKLLNCILLLVGLFAASTDLCRATYMPELPLPFPVTRPQTITFGADNFYWLTGYATDQVIRVNPVGGGIVAYQLPTSPSRPFGIVTVGTNVWFTETAANKIGLLYTNSPINGVGHTIVEFPIHGANSAIIPCGPAGITLGPDGNLWFVEARTNKVGVFSPTTRKLVAEYFTPFVKNQRLYYNIVTGPDGNLWFTDAGGGRICSITTNGLTAVYPLKQDSQPFDIVVGPDSALWFSEFNLSKIGRLTTNCFTSNSFTANGILSTNINTNGVLTEIRVPISAANYISATNAEPYGMAVVTNGTNVNVWFTEAAGSSIDRINSLSPTNLSSPSNYTLTRFLTFSTNAHPARLTSGSDNNIWFDEVNVNAVGLLRLDREIILTATNIPVSSNTFNGTLATFRDVPFNAYPTNYGARVDWGDGSSTNVLLANGGPSAFLHILTNAAGGGFKLNGTHAYTNAGSFPVNITITNHANFFTAGGAIATTNLTITTGIIMGPVPPVTIVASTNGQIALSWTSASGNVVLQENTNLATTNWFNVTNIPVQNPPGTFTVTITPSGEAFFRLKSN